MTIGQTIGKVLGIGGGGGLVPDEVKPKDGAIEVNAGRPTVTPEVSNTDDRPVQVGSHYHFYEVNDALQSDCEQARGGR